MFFSVLQEIEERRQFLVEMEALGQGKKYSTQIMTEISQVCFMEEWEGEGGGRVEPHGWKGLRKE